MSCLWNGLCPKTFGNIMYVPNHSVFFFYILLKCEIPAWSNQVLFSIVPKLTMQSTEAAPCLHAQFTSLWWLFRGKACSAKHSVPVTTVVWRNQDTLWWQTTDLGSWSALPAGLVEESMTVGRTDSNLPNWATAISRLWPNIYCMLVVYPGFSLAVCI